MLRTTTSALLLLLALPLGAQTVAERLDQYLSARVQLGQFSGTVLVAHEGKVLLRKGYGYANLEHLVANAPETKFGIASLTKAFTAFAVDDLARRGRLRLDATMCTYLDACPAAWKEITVSQLVHHTSGIPDYEEALEMGSERFFETMGRPNSAPALVDWARSRPLDFAPGTKFHYSNTAYLILGFIIERASGATYEEYLRQRVFEPLGMKATVHADRSRPQLHRADAYTHQAPLYDVVAGFPLTSAHIRRVPLVRMDAPHADGGLLSTVDDLHAWGRAMLGEGPYSPEQLAELLRPNTPGDYAFGWFAGKRYDRAAFWHTGVEPGMVSSFQLYPARGRS